MKEDGIMKYIFRIIKSKITENNGSSYLEFMTAFVVVILVIYIFAQCFFLINAETLVMDTTKSALRNIEVYGALTQGTVDDITDSLSASSKIDPSSIKIYINDNEVAAGEVVQLRDEAKLRIEVDYNFFLPDSFPNIRAVKYPMQLHATYYGVSGKLNKDILIDTSDFANYVD